jgi:16S rRNA (uracil1498-N3)-methyltransferase
VIHALLDEIALTTSSSVGRRSVGAGAGPHPASDGTEIILAGASAHHLARVLRARRGEQITATDGSGVVFGGRVVDVRPGRVVLVLRQIRSEPRPFPLFRVVYSLVSQQRTAWATEKLVELGAAALAPAVVARGARRPARPAALRERLAAIARAATEQSRRAWLAEVEEPRSLTEALARGEQPILVADSEGGMPLSSALSGEQPRSLTLVTGPEGGFETSERAAMEGMGATRVWLGRHVLRAETAPVVFLSACAFRYGKLDEPVAEWLDCPK